MHSKITLIFAACVAYGAASVMAIPAQGTYDLVERDFPELEARMFDNGFEEFVARQVGAPPAADASAAVASGDPAPPASANTLASAGVHETKPHLHPHHRHAGQRRNGARHSHTHPHAEALVATSDSTVPVPAKNPSAPAFPIAAREVPTHGVGTRRPLRTPSEILDDHTLDSEQRFREMLAAKRHRDAVARRQAIQAARLRRKQIDDIRAAAAVHPVSAV